MTRATVWAWNFFPSAAVIPLRNRLAINDESSRGFLGVVANVTQDKARPVLVSRQFTVGDLIRERTDSL